MCARVVTWLNLFSTRMSVTKSAQLELITKVLPVNHVTLNARHAPPRVLPGALLVTQRLSSLSLMETHAQQLVDSVSTETLRLQNVKSVATTAYHARVDLTYAEAASLTV